MPVSSQRREFKLVACHPALDLVNTLDWRFRESGPEELLTSYDDLLHFITHAELLKPKQVRELLRTATEPEAGYALASCRALREAASQIFYAAVDGQTPETEPIKFLDGMFKKARESQLLAWDGIRLSWQWPTGKPNAETPVWILSGCVSQLLLSEDMQRLRACENPECRWLFLDTSKNHTRRWCDMRLCGNRMKARRFKAQHHA